ncbi:MAG: ester cyclase [Halobacteriaceae archaeon]
MSNPAQENEALIRRFLSDVVAGDDTAAIDAFTTKNFADHNLVVRKRNGSGQIQPFGLMALPTANIDITIEDIIATDDRVAVRTTVTGVHTGSLIDIGITGSAFEIAYVLFCKIEQGRIAEMWSLPDILSLVYQLDGFEITYSAGDTQRGDEK